MKWLITGFEDSAGNATLLEESERLEPGGVGLFWFSLEEFEVQDFDYESLKAFVETGHGNFYGASLNPMTLAASASTAKGCQEVGLANR